VPLSEVVQRLQAAAGTPVDRPRIVAVDGRGGAGKSTLVDLLQAQVPRSAVVHTDDVAWHHAFFDWADLLAENVLLPLRRGEAVDHRPVAWEQRGRPGSIVVPAGLDTVWIEGTGVLRGHLAPLLDASVWLQVDRDEAQRRLHARDGTSPGQLQLIADWEREERPFLLRERPWAHATLIVAGSAVLERVPTAHVAVAPPVIAGT
jgi:uridine kinase